jgi:hypothetical protein
MHGNVHASYFLSAGTAVENIVLFSIQQLMHAYQVIFAPYVAGIYINFIPFVGCLLQLQKTPLPPLPLAPIDTKLGNTMTEFFFYLSDIL